jgi:hypothetical protein
MTIKAVLAALAAALLVAACGGGAEEEPAQTRPIERFSARPLAATVAGPTPTPDQAMDWIERNYPQYFPARKPTGFSNPYYYRYYPETGNYLLVNTQGNLLQVYGNFGPDVVTVGVLDDLSGHVTPSPDYQFSRNEQALFYTPYTANSYFAPLLNETVNLQFTEFVPPTMSGTPFPSDFVALMQYSRTLVYFTRNGGVVWTYPNEGRYVTVFDAGILVSGEDMTQVDALDFSGMRRYRMHFALPVNYAKVQGNRLIVVYSYHAPVDIYEWSNTTGKGALVAQTLPVSYARAATIQGDAIAIADTFGHRTVVASISTGHVLASFPTIYPNDVSWQGNFLYVAEEHNDRILAYSMVTGEKFVVMAPPAPELWIRDLQATPIATCGNDSPSARSRSSDVCSGAFTLYAPNGIALHPEGLFVADTDNSRIVFAGSNGAVSVLSGLNNPVKVAVVPAR